MPISSLPMGRQEAEQIAALMDADLPAGTARGKLRDVVRDEALFDAIAVAAKYDRTADVRPLLAIAIDEWLDWTPPSQMRAAWNPEARGILAGLVTRHGHSDLGRIFPKKRLERATEAATRKANLAMGVGRTVEIVSGEAAGTYVLRDCGGHRVIRVDIVGERVLGAPQQRETALREKYFSSLH